jgi:hypothetical protein
MTAGGLDPADSQETSYRRSATRGSSLDNIRTVNGRTVSKNKSGIRTDKEMMYPLCNVLIQVVRVALYDVDNKTLRVSTHNL